MTVSWFLNVRRRLLQAVFLLALLPAGAAMAQQETAAVSAQVDVAITAQDAGDALREFALVSDIEILFPAELVAGISTNAVNGQFSPEAALHRMLRGTGLTYRAVGPDTYVVEAGELPPDPLAANALAGQNTIGQRRPGIEEIIVTGQKREERIQDVPIAISAFTQEDLTTSQIAGGPDLHLQVPNMTFTKTNFTGYSIQIRGIGTQAISATTDPAVAVALNQTPFVRNRFFEQEFYDLERVEVLRGPQGTLFGRNATAGVVNLITNKPKFQHESMLSYDRGNYGSQRWEAMINIPVVDDRMAFRLAAAGTRRDGYVTNELTDNPIDGRDLWSTRASLRFAPNDRLTVDLIWEHFEEDDDRLRSGKQLCKKDVVTEVRGIPVTSFDQTLLTSGLPNSSFIAVQPRLSQGCERASLYSDDAFQTPNGTIVYSWAGLSVLGLPSTLRDPYLAGVQSKDLRAIESTVDPEYRARSDIGELQIDYQLTDTLLLESETAYNTDEVFSLQDLNRFSTAPGAWDTEDASGQLVDLGVLSEDGDFCDPQIGCADRLVAVDISRAESRQFSQEFRISSQFPGPFNFSLGANYLRYDTVDKYYVFINALTLATVANQHLTKQEPYVAGESPNDECLILDLYPADPTRAFDFGCIYVEQNSIGNLNDTGHNYFLSKNPFNLRSYALFGETYWNITDALKLTAGLRWSVDRKTAPIIPSWAFAGSSIGYPTLETIEQEWREPTGRLVLDWKPNLGFTDETLLYGSISRGYKAGGANPPPFVAVGAPRDIFDVESITKPKTFDAEFVNAFEVGTKNTLLDGAVTLNAAAFYYDYTGYQISEIVDRAAFNRNFDAEVWGAELEADFWVTERLRLGFKGGYQRTRIRDGEKAVDLMDRTDGGTHLFVTDIPNPNFDDTLEPDERRPVSEYVTDAFFDELPADQEFYAYEEWTILRPWPAYPTSCVLPEVLFGHPDGTIWDVGQGGGNVDGGCIKAFSQGRDPVTNLPYVPAPPTQTGGFSGGWNVDGVNGNYPGFNPEWSPNNGEGFAKDLGGNELPNAPRFTMTWKVDYTVPLTRNWTATAHTDIYWQDESWWRIFNDHEYNRLEDYFTMNVAAIFRNDVAGWNIMAYVKNVTDEDAITGGFLYSDDVGLTTNVFLVEPRLYGIRATKRWDGGGPAEWVGGGAAALLGKEPGEPSPFSLTLGGNLLRPKDSPNEIFAPAFISAFDPDIDPSSVQSRDMDWGDGREIVLTYAPENGWKFSLGMRVGESTFDDGDDFNDRILLEGERFYGCLLDTTTCEEVIEDPERYEDGATFPPLNAYRTNYSLTDIREVEEHMIIDFSAGRDIGLGNLEGTLSAGLRYAKFESRTDTYFTGQPDWVLPEECMAGGSFPACNKYAAPAQHHEYTGAMEAEREFEGLGPVVAWEASTRLFGDARGGHVDLDWSVSGGVLFGKQETEVEGVAAGAYFDQEIGTLSNLKTRDLFPVSSYAEPFSHERDDETIATVPTVGASLGLTYRVGGGSLGFGYRWERYYGVIDGGIEERKVYDRTVDGPYLKVTFGGGE